MAYIDQTYYDTVYKGTPIPTSEFPSLSERASDVIDMLTNYKIKMQTTGLAAYSTFIQDMVKKATAAETEYLYNQGGTSAINGSSSTTDIDNVKIGNFSYTDGGNSSTSSLSRSQKMVSPMVLSFLSATGLLYSGIDTRDSSVWSCYPYGYHN